MMSEIYDDSIYPVKLIMIIIIYNISFILYQIGGETLYN